MARLREVRSGSQTEEDSPVAFLFIPFLSLFFFAMPCFSMLPCCWLYAAEASQCFAS